MGIPYILQKSTDFLFQKKKLCSKFGSGSPYWIHTSYLNENSIIYSGGVGEDISFEKDLSKNLGPDIYLFDPTPTGEKTIKNTSNKKLKFIRLALSNNSGKLGLSKQKSSEGDCYIIGDSHKFPCTSLSDFMKKKGHKEVDLLKLDIEGAEYLVVNDILNNKISVSQITLELHHRFKGIGYLKSIVLIARLYLAGYCLIYKNIDDYTFIKRKFLSRI